MKTIRGESKKPRGLLQREHLGGPERSEATGSAPLPGDRPGLRAFTNFRPPAPEPVPSTPSTPVAASALALEAFPDRPLVPPPNNPRTLLQGTRAPARPQPPPHLSFFAPTLTALLLRIRSHLESTPERLMELNPSRRDAICHYLEQLAGGVSQDSATRLQGLSSTERLRYWTNWRNLPSHHHQALLVYFEDVALMSLAQAILLKAWSDRSVRNWKREDLKDLNAALHGALRPMVPMDREGWQFTRPNLFSWFKLPHEIQEALWSEFSAWRVLDEGPELLMGLVEASRQIQPDRQRPVGFDDRVYAALWKHTPEPDSAIQGRLKRSGYSPTLRDGAIVRKGPTDWSWYCWESAPFSLYLAELSLLWWGPSCPPYWSLGSGLESSIQSQLSLNISVTGKPMVAQRIQEMEACDVAWVLEEQVLRGSQRSPEAQVFRETIDANPSLKRLRTGGTSRGHLQACVAMTKLRPDAVLWWLREERLHASDGSEALQFLLDRGKLIAEWDFSGLSLGSATTTGKPAIPRYLYLFKRVTNVQDRLDHHPTRLWVRGQLRSQIEIPMVLEEALQQGLLGGESQEATKAAPQRGWQILGQRHPLSQREWVDQWPEASATEELAEIQALRRQSRPLASVVTIRGAEAASSAARAILQGLAPNSSTNRAFLVVPCFENGKRRLRTRSPDSGTAESDGFTLIAPDEMLVAPLRAYLESDLVVTWLDHKASRKNQRWALKEQDLKILPVPERLLQTAGSGVSADAPTFALPLPGRWEKLASDLHVAPKNVRQALGELQHDAAGDFVRSVVFVRAARILHERRQLARQISNLITDDGSVRWRELVRTFSNSDFVPVSFHPEISISGNMPIQTPIVHQTTLKSPQAIVLATEAGQQMMLEIPNRLLMDVIWDQIRTLDRPTWSEVVEFVRAPRRSESLESRAADLIRVQGEHQAMVSHLEAVLAETIHALVRSSDAC